METFLEKNEEACRLAALELNRKSQMVSEAVEEVLELVQNAAVTFRLIIGVENDVIAQGRIRRIFFFIVFDKSFEHVLNQFQMSPD